jgi:hypothetical protein
MQASTSKPQLIDLKILQFLLKKISKPMIGQTIRNQQENAFP